MLNTIKQWIFVAAALALSWPLSSWMLSHLRAYDGSIGVPLARDLTLSDALLPVAASLCAFAILAWVAARMTHRYVGSLIFGLCWVVLAHRFTPVDTLLRMAVSDPAVGASGLKTLYFKFSLEALAWSLPAVLFVFAFARTTPSRYPTEHGWKSPDSLTSAALSLLGTLALSWLFVRTEERDQSVGGLVAASALSVMVVRMIWSNANGSLLIVVLTAGAGLLGALSSAFMISPDVLDNMSRSTLWPLIRVLPLDWVAGCLFGSALGIGLARTFSEVDQPEPRPVAALKP